MRPYRSMARFFRRGRPAPPEVTPSPCPTCGAPIRVLEIPDPLTEADMAAIRERWAQQFTTPDAAHRLRFLDY